MDIMFNEKIIKTYPDAYLNVPAWSARRFVKGLTYASYCVSNTTATALAIEGIKFQKIKYDFKII